MNFKHIVTPLRRPRDSAFRLHYEGLRAARHRDDPGALPCRRAWRRVLPSCWLSTVRLLSRIVLRCHFDCVVSPKGDRIVAGMAAFAEQAKISAARGNLRPFRTADAAIPPDRQKGCILGKRRPLNELQLRAGNLIGCLATHLTSNQLIQQTRTTGPTASSDCRLASCRSKAGGWPRSPQASHRAAAADIARPMPADRPSGSLSRRTGSDRPR